jgi:Phage tail tube protein
MPNATSAGYRVGYVAESTPGNTPASALTLIRNVGGGGKFTASATESDELHLAEVPDLVRVGADAAGTINGELSYAALDDFLQGILGGTWATNVVKAGTTKRTFTIEDQYTDAGVYVPWKYCLIESLVINFAVGARPTFKLGYVSGSPPAAAATATAGTGGPTAAPTNDIMTPAGSIQLAQEGGSGSLLAGAPGITAFSIEITRPVIKQPQLGTFALASADPSRLTVKGSFSVYFATKALFDKYLANTQTSLAFTVGGAASLKYAFLMSKVRFADGGPQEVAKDQPVIQTYQYQATYDATNSTLQVTRTP